MSGLFAPSSGHVLSKRWTSQKIFALEFSTVANGGGWRYHGSKSVGLTDRIFLEDGNIWVSAVLSCLASYKLCAIGVHDVRICVVDSLLEWHILHVSSIC